MAGRAEEAGLAYFAVIFAIGFAFGTIRVLLLEARLGTELAVALEIPVMLGLSYLAARWLVRRFDVGDTTSARLRMGLIGLVLLLLAETALGVAVFGQTVAGQLAAYATLRGMLTLVGQIGFGLVPLLVPPAGGVRSPTTRNKGNSP